MTKRKLFVTLGAICIAAGMTLTGSTGVMAKEAEMYTSTDASGNVQTYIAEDMKEDATIASDLEIVTSDGTTSEKVQLAVPTNLSWGTNWHMCWDGVPEAEGYYGIEVYKDGEKFWGTSWSGLQGDTASVGFSQLIMESGTYKFRVKSNNYYDQQGLISSDWSEFSEERVYVKPTTTLAKPVVYWDATQVGVVHYKTVGNAGGYKVTLYYYNDEGNESSSASWDVSAGYKDVAGIECTKDLSYKMNEEGYYYVTVQALSGNVDEIANSVEGQPTKIFSTVKSAEQIGSAITDAMANGTAAEALSQITGEVAASSMVNAMQTNEEVLNQVAELEALYAEEMGIEVADPVVSAEASQYVDSTKVNVVGAGLNAQADTIGLEIDVPETPEYINDQHYKNTVQLDITLVNAGYAIHGDLTMPITITMPIPAGIEARCLVILHYDAYGNAEKVNLRVNDDNTVTFTVKSLSTFVLAEGNPFGDISETSWKYPYLLFAYRNGMMSGKGTTDDGKVKISPDASISRGEFVQILYAKEGKPEIAFEPIFSDVEETKAHWFHDAVIWAYKNGITAGSDGKFNPKKAITRQEMSLMLYQYAEYKEYSTEVGDFTLTGFTDVDNISSWATESMTWANANAIINGNGTSLDPRKEATRAQTAAMIRSFMVAYEGVEPLN